LGLDATTWGFRLYMYTHIIHTINTTVQTNVTTAIMIISFILGPCSVLITSGICDMVTVCVCVTVTVLFRGTNTVRVTVCVTVCVIVWVNAIAFLANPVGVANQVGVATRDGVANQVAVAVNTLGVGIANLEEDTDVVEECEGEIVEDKLRLRTYCRGKKLVIHIRISIILSISYKGSWY